MPSGLRLIFFLPLLLTGLLQGCATSTMQQELTSDARQQRVDELRLALIALGDDIGPVLNELTETLKAAEGTLEAARLQLRGDSAQVYQLQATLREVEGAAAALREFFDYLERNPEALIQGRRGR